MKVTYTKAEAISLIHELYNKCANQALTIDIIDDIECNDKPIKKETNITELLYDLGISIEKIHDKIISRIKLYLPNGYGVAARMAVVVAEEDGYSISKKDADKLVQAVVNSDSNKNSNYVNPNLRKLLQSFGYYKDENHKKLINTARSYLYCDESIAIDAIHHVSYHMEDILCIIGEDAKLFLKAVKAHEIEHVDDSFEDKIKDIMIGTGITKKGDIIKLITISRCAWKYIGGAFQATIQAIISEGKELGYNIDKNMALKIFNVSDNEYKAL